MDKPIPLSQKIYLMGINPEKGGISSRSYTAMDYVLLGTLFMELYLEKKISFDEKRIIVRTTSSDNQLHRFLLQKMSKAKSPRKIGTWINKLYFSLKQIREEVQSGLVNQHLIKMETRRFLFFKWKTPVATNKQYLFKLERKIENDIFKGSSAEEDLIFLSFIEPAGILHRLFSDRKKRKQAKQQLKKLLLENRVSGAVADAITASQAIAASVAVSVAATSAVTS
ncbi:GPP34 family phosphoprotein [uncultured Draconibacterium sp.]|uniref:GOLPH3/VPS74 family protein n=1 Tax=uncultured Draconibacterium sp. TaxID=1573823 RepID=UPI003260A2CC